MLKLPQEFYNRDTLVVAEELLGKYLVRNINQETKIGRIVEVESYIGGLDLASHSSKGITKRTSIMFGKAGFAYVYQIYGIYFCLNVVTDKEGHGSAVLIRAIEPLQNISERTQGPGLLCKALKIDKQLYGEDLQGDNLYLTESDTNTDFSIIKCPRIGVSYAKEWAEKPYRFYIKGNPYVSKIIKL